MLNMLMPRQPKIAPEIIARFRPAALETLLVSLLRSAQVVCLLGSIVAFLNYFALSHWDEAGWLPFLLFGLTLLGFYRGLGLSENYRPDGILVVAAEWLVIFIVMRAVALVAGFSETLVSPVFVADFVAVAAAWQMGRGWSRYYLYLFVRPTEVTEVSGGAASSKLGDQIFYDHREAYNNIRQNWYWLAGLQVVIAAAGIFSAKTFQPTISNPNFGASLLLFGAIQLLLGLPLLAWARYRYLRTVWRLNKLEAPARLSTHWAFYLAALLVVALLPALLLASLNIANGVRLPDFKFNSKPPEGTPPAPPPDLFPPITLPPFSPPPRHPTEPFRLPDWLITAFQLLIVAAILWFAMWLLYRAGWVSPVWRKFSLPRIWLNFRDWLRSLLGSGRTLEGFEKVARDNEGRGFSLFGLFRRDHLPHDPRGQVRFYYRRLLERAGKAGLPRATGQTPGEYASYLAPELETDQPLTPHLDGLTGLYEEARFSPHPVDQTQADAARQHTEPLTTHFRHKSRRARAPRPEEQNEQEQTE